MPRAPPGARINSKGQIVWDDDSRGLLSSLPFGKILCAVGAIMLLFGAVAGRLPFGGARNGDAGGGDPDTHAGRTGRAHAQHFLDDSLLVWRIAQTASGKRDPISGEKIWTNDDKESAINLRETRCATTNYAITAYFCGTDEALQTYKGMPGVDVLKGYLLGALADPDPAQDLTVAGSPVKATRAEMIFRCNFNRPDKADSLGHTWIIHAFPRADDDPRAAAEPYEFAVYQSFIRHYSLAEFLGKQRRAGALYLDAAAMGAFLDRIAALERATRWDDAADRAYQKNFGVSLMAGFYGGALFKAPEFDWAVGCVNTPDGARTREAMAQESRDLVEKVLAKLGAACAAELRQVMRSSGAGSFASLLEAVSDRCRMEFAEAAMSQVDDDEL